MNNQNKRNLDHFIKNCLASSILEPSFRWQALRSGLRRSGLIECLEIAMLSGIPNEPYAVESRINVNGSATLGLCWTFMYNSQIWDFSPSHMSIKDRPVIKEIHSFRARKLVLCCPLFSWSFYLFLFLNSNHRSYVMIKSLVRTLHKNKEGKEVICNSFWGKQASDITMPWTKAFRMFISKPNLLYSEIE